MKITLFYGVPNVKNTYFRKTSKVVKEIVAKFN